MKSTPALTTLYPVHEADALIQRLDQLRATLWALFGEQILAQQRARDQRHHGASAQLRLKGLE